MNTREAIAKRWVDGRELDLLKDRVMKAMENFEMGDSYDPDLKLDPEAYAEELQVYAELALGSLPLPFLEELVRELIAKGEPE